MHTGVSLLSRTRFHSFAPAPSFDLAMCVSPLGRAGHGPHQARHATNSNTCKYEQADARLCHPAVGQVRPQGGPASGKYLAQENVVGRPVDYKHDASEGHHVEQLVDLEEAALVTGREGRQVISVPRRSRRQDSRAPFSRCRRDRRSRSRGSGRRSHGGAAPSRRAVE